MVFRAVELLEVRIIAKHDLLELHPRKCYPCSGPTDVKYPPNVGRGLSSADLEVDRLYEPKQNKKIVRYCALNRH